MSAPDVGTAPRRRAIRPETPAAGDRRQVRTRPKACARARGPAARSERGSGSSRAARRSRGRQRPRGAAPQAAARAVRRAAPGRHPRGRPPRASAGPVRRGLHFGLPGRRQFAVAQAIGRSSAETPNARMPSPSPRLAARPGPAIRGRPRLRRAAARTSVRVSPRACGGPARPGPSRAGRAADAPRSVAVREPFESDRDGRETPVLGQPGNAATHRGRVRAHSGLVAAAGQRGPRRRRGPSPLRKSSPSPPSTAAGPPTPAPTGDRGSISRHPAWACRVPLRVEACGRSPAPPSRRCS